MKGVNLLVMFTALSICWMGCIHREPVEPITDLPLNEYEEVDIIWDEPPPDAPPLHYDKHLYIFEYDSTYTDSTLVCERWYVDDRLEHETGNYYYSIPVESEFVDARIIEEAEGKQTHETFDERVCEVGGSSAWNKYIISYNDVGKPVEVLHYKAWWNEGLGEADRPNEPEYFLGETVEFEYHSNTTLQRSYDEDGKLLETITRIYYESGDLKMAGWDAWDTYRYRVWY